MADSAIVAQIRERMVSYDAAQLEGDYPDAAVVVALSDDINPGIALIKRASHLRLHAGEIGFPGGKQDDTDPDLLFTATREMEEEIGVPASMFENIGPMHQWVTRTDIRVTPFVGVLPANYEFEINRDELDTAFFLPVEQLASGELFHIWETEKNGVMHQLPRFCYRDYDVTGITALILADVANTFLDAKLPVSTNPLDYR